MNNVHPETGIPYGYIAANSLNPDLVHELMYVHGMDLSYQESLAEHLKGLRAEHLERHEDLAEFDEDRYVDEFSDGHEDSEPTIAGTHEDVRYRSSWLGGALNFWIFFSPHTNTFDKCSPCVPNAGNLDCPNPNGELAYDVPADWRNPE